MSNVTKYNKSRYQRVFDDLLIGKKNLIGAEVGVYRGQHAREMLEKLDIQTLYLVDPWQDYKEYQEIARVKTTVAKAYLEAKELLQPYTKKLKWIKKFSVEASKLIADESLDFVYIDANHAYKFVKLDIKIWAPKVKKSGLVGGHDYWLFKGVQRAVNEYCQKNRIKLNKVDSQKENICTRKDDWWFVK